MKLERTKNTIRNIMWGLLNRFVNLLFPFILRTVFIYALGAEYLGLNSLFTSILTVLNLAELGFSSAVVYNMYKPVAENDTETICALMQYYKKVYRIIGFAVSIAGLAVIPFLERFIHGEYPQDINLTLLYLLFLGNTAVSYFLFAYKGCILTVYQREDIVSKVNIVLKAVMYLAQTVLLVLMKSYYGYVLCTIANTILTNIIVAYFSNKLYPQYQCRGTLTQNSRKNIRKNIQGLMIGKLCMASRNAFDNIFLSAFLGLQTVTIYGNYYYIMNAISGILLIATTSIGAGVGNSVATESVEKNYEDYKKFTFLYAWVASWCAVCLFCLYQPFMRLWMGEELLFPMIDVVLICVYFYSLTMGDVRSQYSMATGLFWENRFYVLTEAVVNIVLNYFLGKHFGVHGIIIATWISIFFINFGWGSSVIFKHYFVDYSLWDYYGKHLFYFANTVVASALTFAATNLISGYSIVSLLGKGFICLIVPNLYFLLVYRKRKEYKLSVQFIQNNILSKLRKNGGKNTL